METQFDTLRNQLNASYFYIRPTIFNVIMRVISEIETLNEQEVVNPLLEMITRLEEGIDSDITIINDYLLDNTTFNSPSRIIFRDLLNRIKSTGEMKPIG